MKEKKPDSKNYVFGDLFGNAMAKTTQKFQMEASMMAVVMLIIGIFLTGIYVCFFTNFGLYFKIMTGTNTFFGMLLMYSNLVGLFQAYRSYMEVMEVQESIKNMMSDETPEELQTLKGGDENE